LKFVLENKILNEIHIRYNIFVSILVDGDNDFQVTNPVFGINLRVVE